MLTPLYALGLASGTAGGLVCAAAGLGRLAGHYYLFGFEATTLFLAGTALMVFACMVRLYQPRDK